MSKQFDQLILLYKQILATSQEVKILIDKENYDEALSRDLHKSQLIQKTSFLFETIDLTDYETNIIKKYKEEIAEQELINLNQLESSRNEVIQKLKITQNQSKLNNVYSQQENEQGSILDCSD